MEARLTIDAAEAARVVEAAINAMPEGPRDARQNSAVGFIASAFGAESATDPKRRAIRLIEEAVELAQACGVSRTMIEVVTDEVFTKPPGEPAQEVGGVGLTLLAVAQSLGLSADRCEAVEVFRCRQKHAQDSSHFRERDKAKPYRAQVMDAPAGAGGTNV